jgi:hypothetical protein
VLILSGGKAATLALPQSGSLKLAPPIIGGVV